MSQGLRLAPAGPPRHAGGMRILLIEDDRTLADYVAKSLRAAGHAVDVCGDGREGLYMVAGHLHDLVLLDRMLPGVDGLTILQTMRAAGNPVPVMILTALGEVDDRVDGLRKGGDDYLVKPFSIQELLARVEALGRRQGGMADGGRLAAGGIEMDLLRREVKVAGRLLRLTNREFGILELLLSNAGRVVTRAMILEKVWDYRFDPQTNIVDQHVSRLRHKMIEETGISAIETVRGLGYRVPD